MRKVLIITMAEVRAFVHTKAFIVSMMLVPLMMLAGPLLTKKMQDVDATPRAFAVLDQTDVLFPALEKASRERDQMIASKTSTEGQARFIPSRVRLEGEGPEALSKLRIELSEQIRQGKLFAFIEIPAEVVGVGEKTPGKISYVSDSPTYWALRTWLDQVLSREVRARRYDAVGIAPEVVTRLERPVHSENLGLWQTEAGAAKPAAPIDQAKLLFAPMIATVLLVMLVMLTAQWMLNAVIEEKMSRVSEVLLGSVTPFELMLGKLLGGTTVALGLGILYAISGYSIARRIGAGDAVTPTVVVAFVVFLILALLMFGSIYLAVGAACSDLKEAQSLLMPVVFLGIMPPLLLLPAILQSPASPFAVATSMFPTTAPFAMLLRLCLHPSPPMWQVAVSVTGIVAAATFCVWAAGRVFRVGLLLQGKGASLAQIARWVSVK